MIAPSRKGLKKFTWSPCHISTARFKGALFLQRSPVATFCWLMDLQIRWWPCTPIHQRTLNEYVPGCVQNYVEASWRGKTWHKLNETGGSVLPQPLFRSPVLLSSPSNHKSSPGGRPQEDGRIASQQSRQLGTLIRIWPPKQPLAHNISSSRKSKNLSATSSVTL